MSPPRPAAHGDESYDLVLESDDDGSTRLHARAGGNTRELPDAISLSYSPTAYEIDCLIIQDADVPIWRPEDY